MNDDNERNTESMIYLKKVVIKLVEIVEEIQ
jgi:hypothetical protein